ncbi:uncharacterized protein V6R79_019676 [Siganus canaliculatus]
MGDSKFCLSIFLLTLTLTYAQEEHAKCLLNQRYKALHKYEYEYSAHSLNGVNGASDFRNGLGTSCKVEIEVPQACSFIIRTTSCGLTEVTQMDAEGNPVFAAAPSSDAFAAEMERYPLKVVVEGAYDVKLYPEDGETETILNVKRGIISALAVPLLELDKSKDMPTIHGKCKTNYKVTENFATEITFNRDLSRCDRFVPMRDHTSPLALITGMHYPLAQLVRSSQNCNYKFDNEKKHMTSGSCTENHILIPFSHNGEYGVTNVGKQELTLVQVSPHNERVFDHSDIVKGLHMETVEDKSAVQDKDTALNLLRELATLPEAEGERRAHIFHKLVTMVRRMKAETLSPAIPEALAVSRVLTYQVLAQCGTPECSSAIMQILRTFDSSALEVDAGVFALGLVSNPSALLINDMLEMAKYKPSKPIMYALSNVVKRFYKAEEKLIPEIYAVAEFMAAQLGDCSGDKDTTFMTLRVVGNMAPALVKAGPALRAAVMQCVNQAATSPEVQQAAIQVYRLTSVPDEAREVLMQVLLDSTSPVQKRIAAYLVLMKDPQSTELAQLADALPNEQDKQVKSFVISHITNILSSTEPQTQELRQKIRDALQGNEIGTIMDPTKFSRNYKMGSVEGNMIFEDNSYLPKEVMLEMTLKAFGYDIDMMEIGMEGKGFEPTVEALFGANGFFPDTVLKTMYFVSDNMPLRVNEILKNMLPALRRERMKRQASQNLMRDIGRNFNKLVREMKTAESPEAMVYLRLLGNELGYLRTNEIEKMAYSAAMMVDSMFKMFPMDLMKALMTKTDNTFFAHYIFMDNEFFLPTVTGVPLRISLSGTFTPGVKGGLQIARDMSEVTFMPSAGIEFVTQVGAHLPEYVNSGLEMHTNIFHESGLSAKISMERDNVKLTIPAPTGPTKLIKMTNTLVAVTGSEMKTIPPMVMDKVDVNECTPVFAGMKYCTALQYTDAFSQRTAPYFPFTGDSKFVVELHPTGEVTEYTATVAYELLREGEEGKQKVDSVKFSLRAEGADPTEARAVMKYNRRKNVITADIEIPDYDVEAGFRLGVVDGNTKGKGTHSVSLDFINKNIPQLSLVGRANLKAMKEGMLQVQLLIPSVNADATITANMKRDEDLELELKSVIKVMAATSEQKIEMKYDASKIEFEFKSDVNADTTSLPNSDMLEMYGNQLLDMQVGQTDMKVRHIFKNFVEAANNYMEKYGADIPYIQNFQVPDMPEISLPETMFLNTEAKAIYHFNNNRFTFTVPLPLGGKSTEELNFPPALTTPSVSLPHFGLEIVSMEIPIPELVVPESLSLSIPLFGKAELSTQFRSNLYDMEASMAAGKDVVETPSYSAKFDVKGTSPFDILSINFEGSGMLATTDSIKAQLKSSLNHKFLDASFNVVEDVTFTDKINWRSSSKIEATSPFSLNIAIEHTGVAAVNTEEISADSNFDGMVRVGPMYGKTISTQSVTIFPFRPEAKIDSTFNFDSTIAQAKNTIVASLANGELFFVSNTNAFEDILTHVAELSFKDSKLSLKSDANALALGMKIHNQAQASLGAYEITMRMETNADHSENRVYSLLTVSLDSNGLAVNSDATMKIIENEAIHKATLRMNKDGLITSGTNTLQSPLALENTFSVEVDASRAALSFTDKAAMRDMNIDNANTLTMTLSGLDFKSKTEATVSEYASYTHEVAINLKPYTASANVKNNLNLLKASFINEGQLKAELYKMDLTGILKATYGEEEVMHTYELNYADMTVNAKCSTVGKLFGTHMSNNAELEVIGLAARITNDARFNSQPVRFDHTIRCSIVPFDFNLDAIFNADGDMTMYGKHSAQLYAKLLLRAQPLAFASSHECRALVKQQLDNDFTLDTISENSMDIVLSVTEQRSSFQMKSKVNDHIFNQDMSLYNTAERSGIEVSSSFLTSMLNTVSTDNHEISISGFLKYDKSTNSHIIQFPMIESFSAVLENIKGLIVYVAEELQKYIDKEETRAALKAIPEHLSDLFSQMNVEGKLYQLKQYFNDFSKEYTISVDDLETSLRRLKVNVEKLLVDLTVYIQHIAHKTMDIFANGMLPETLIQRVQQQLDAINEEYDLKAMVVYVIDTVTEMIQQIELQKLKGSSIEFLQDIDVKYGIKAKLEAVMTEIKHLIETFDMQAFVVKVGNYLKAKIETLYSQIPTEIFSDLANYLSEIIQTTNIDVLGRINTVHNKIREVIVKFEVDRKFQVILTKVMELIEQFRIEETIGTVVRMVKDADISTKFLQVYEDVISYCKSSKIKDILLQFNQYIDSIEQKLKSYDFNHFVEQANQIIAEYIVHLNELIRSLEIPQKLEATKEFVRFVLSTINNSLEKLKEIKMTDLLKDVRDICDQVILNDLKGFADIIKQEITNFDANTEITYFLQLVRKCYTEFTTIVTDGFTSMVEIITKVAPDQKIVHEIMQIINGIITGVKEVDFTVPSFTIPLTDLIVPSMKLSIDNLHQFEIPVQLDIPEFTVLGFYTVQATTISINDIKQKLIDFIDFLLSFERKIADMSVSIGGLTMNFLSALPELSLPEITVPEFSFPRLPQFPEEKLVKTVELPTLKLATIPSEITIPGFGKLSSEIKFHSPIYTIRNAAEIQSSLDVDEAPQLTAYLTTQGTSLRFESLNFNLDSTARVAVANGQRVIASETLKITHAFLVLDHHTSLTFYDYTVQGSAKTTVKANTTPYNAELLNEAFIATKGGLSATVDTSYKHVLNLPIVAVTGECSVIQKAVLRQEGSSFTISVGNDGNIKFNSHNSIHKSDLQVIVNPRTAKLTFSSNTDNPLVNMRQTLSVDSVIFNNFKLDIRSEAEGISIKNNLVVGSVNANLPDMKFELKATHNTELVGSVNGALNNVIEFALCPTQVTFSFQNKGNMKVSLNDAFTVKVDLQNDYTASVESDKQYINAVAMVQLNEHKLSSKFTIENSEEEAAVLCAVEGKSNLDFLTKPISIPEIYIPFVDLHTPAISDLDLYDQTGLSYIFTTSEQTVDLDAKFVYKKSKAAPLVVLLDALHIPSVGNVIMELSVNSAIINVNVNAGMYAENDLMFSLEAATTSAYESLTSSLQGSSSVTTKRGIKFNNNLHVKNHHIDGIHESTVHLNTDTFDADVLVVTKGMIALPIFNLEASQNLHAKSKTTSADSVISIKCDFNIPVIKAIGKADAEHKLKLKGYVSMESSTRTNVDCTVLDDYLVLGILDNEINLDLNNNGLRTTSKVIADAKLNLGTTKVIGMDVNANLAAEASLSHVYTELKYTSNNEANLFSLNTNGKHIAEAKINVTPISVTADIEIDFSQPNTLGDFSIFDKSIAEVSATKQKMSTNIKIATPLYATNLAAEADNNAPIFKVNLKSSATSPMVFLEYDLDTSITINFEDAGISLSGKTVFTHSDLNLEIQQLTSHTLSNSHLTANVDINSPGFTDMNFRYAVRKDGISATISIPSTGFLGFQFHGRIPSQMNARLYGRYASQPEKDVDVFTMRASAKDVGRMSLKMVFNMEAPEIMLSGLQERLPAMTMSLSKFAEKYQLLTHADQLKNVIIFYTEEAHSIAENHGPNLSQVSILFRNTVRHYQKTGQVFLDAVIKVLRETRVKMPSTGEMIPVIEVLNKMTTSISAIVEKAIHLFSINLEYASNAIITMSSKIQVTMPIGDVMAGAKIIEQIKGMTKNVQMSIMYYLSNFDTLDVLLEKLGDTLEFYVAKGQDFVDNSLKSDVLDALAFYVNALYKKHLNLMKTITEIVNEATDRGNINNFINYFLEILRSTMNQFNYTVTDYLRQAPTLYRSYINVKGRKLEITL